MNTSPQQLKRVLNFWGAIMLGLGSMIGTGVFVSIGLAAGIAGPAVILAVILAAMVAVCNGLSSAQLAASHPVSGGTYEYGYRYLGSSFGFTAGWMFLIAKSASAASAALGFSGYVISLLGLTQRWWLPLALFIVALFTLIVLGGIRRSNLTNTLIVSVTLLALLFFVVGGLPRVASEGGRNLLPFFAGPSGERPVRALFHAAAFMFVAYTGYGRIATLGEEVREPRRTIPRAIVVVMLVTLLLYLSVSLVGIGAVGAAQLSFAAKTNAAPLVAAAAQFDIPFAPQILSIGAVTAMLGVLLNLILGLSRVLLAMGRRGDMPAPFARLNAAGTTPVWAVIAVGLGIAALVLIGDVRTTWSFSTFTVLIYYALTNLSALRLAPEQRLAPAWLSVLGLLSCVFLAFWVEWQTWLMGLGLILLGLLWHAIVRKWTRQALASS